MIASLTEQALAGEAVPSMLGEDLATPLCAEVALGLVRSSAEAQHWYAHTLHGRLTPNPAALEQALQTLLGEGFILARPDGSLAATPLGHATSSLMVRVETALRLERFLRGCANPADADALEEEVLRTVCSRSDEWGDSVASADAGTLAGRLAGYDAALAEWAPLRLRAFAAGACLLSGVSMQTLELPDSAAAAQTARNDLPRLLGFLSRRATERREPLPHVALAAEDLSLSLRAALPLRGQALRLAPLPEAHLLVRGRMLWLAGVPEGVRCWVRLSASSDDYVLAPTLSSNAAPLAPLTALSTPGAGASIWATVVTRDAGTWSHAALHIQVQVPHGRDESGLAPCRHNWKVLAAYAHPAMRRLKLARYLATGAGKAIRTPAKPRQRALTPDPRPAPARPVAGRWRAGKAAMVSSSAACAFPPAVARATFTEQPPAPASMKFPVPIVHGAPMGARASRPPRSA